MARENKIGLLVGLAFIIAVGILCSDYLSVANEPPQKSLQVAGSAVRSSMGEARSTEDGQSPPALVRVPNTITPTGLVATAGELASRARQAAAAVVPPIITGINDSPLTSLAAVSSNRAPVPPAQNPDLTAAAKAAGESVVDPTEHAAVPPTPRADARTVEAESGDSLGTLAERAYGSSTRATRAALVAANPSLKANPNLIVAGRSYLVTSSTDADAAPASPSVGTVATYTVRQGDTLWSIAAKQVGTSRAVPAILDLNPDIQRGSPLRLNMRLRLPKRKATAD